MSCYLSLLTSVHGTLSREHVQLLIQSFFLLLNVLVTVTWLSFCNKPKESTKEEQKSCYSNSKLDKSILCYVFPFSIEVLSFTMNTIRIASNCSSQMLHCFKNDGFNMYVMQFLKEKGHFAYFFPFP